MEEENRKASVPALDKSLDIIEYMMLVNKPLSTKDISNALAIPIATTYRIINNLEYRGYIRQVKYQSGSYVLGFKFLQLSESVKKQLNLNVVALPTMRELADNTGHTVNIGVLQNDGVLYILQELPSTPVSIIAGLGVVISLNTSAIGKVLTAFLPEMEQYRFLKVTKLLSKTENSIIEQNKFKKELDIIKTQRFGRDNEEYAIGISCLAAPIFNFAGEAIAAIGITGHTRDYENETIFLKLKNEVMSAANNISRGFGYLG